MSGQSRIGSWRAGIGVSRQGVGAARQGRDSWPRICVIGGAKSTVGLLCNIQQYSFGLRSSISNGRAALVCGFIMWVRGDVLGR